MAKSRHEIRGSRKARFIGTVIGWLMNLYTYTIRYKYEDPEDLCNRSADKPFIWLMWHNRVLTHTPRSLAWVSKKSPVKRDFVCLTSASDDGAVIEAVVAVFKVGSIRGSSSRRGVAALAGLSRALKDNKSIVVTPDGPRGPVYRLQPGVVKLAQKAQVPIVIAHAQMKKYWELKTWDKFRVPYPFSKVKIIFESVTIPADLSEEEFESERISLEERMKQYN